MDNDEKEKLYKAIFDLYKYIMSLSTNIPYDIDSSSMYIEEKYLEYRDNSENKKEDKSER